MKNPLKVLVQELIQEGVLNSKKLIEAFLKIDRKDFVLDDLKEYAYLNQPLSIGFGQTISQPLVVAFMIELLEAKKGEKILDIGAGSGWTTALLAYLVGEKGKVLAIERIPELKEFGEKNVSKYNFVKKGIVKFYLKDGSYGLPEEAPFDKILCSASLNSKEIIKRWISQLKEKGKIVTPYKEEILLIEKDNDKIKEESFYGFSFVPLIED